MMQDKEMISERQAAALIGVHASTLMHWRKAGLVPVKYDEKKYLTGKSRISYDKAQFRDWIHSTI